MFRYTVDPQLEIFLDTRISLKLTHFLINFSDFISNRGLSNFNLDINLNITLEVLFKKINVWQTCAHIINHSFSKNLTKAFFLQFCIFQ